MVPITIYVTGPVDMCDTPNVYDVLSSEAEVGAGAGWYYEDRDVIRFEWSTFTIRSASRHVANAVAWAMVELILHGVASPGNMRPTPGFGQVLGVRAHVGGHVSDPIGPREVARWLRAHGTARFGHRLAWRQGHAQAQRMLQAYWGSIKHAGSFSRYTCERLDHPWRDGRDYAPGSERVASIDHAPQLYQTSTYNPLAHYRITLSCSRAMRRETARKLAACALYAVSKSVEPDLWFRRFDDGYDQEESGRSDQWASFELYDAAMAKPGCDLLARVLDHLIYGASALGVDLRHNPVSIRIEGSWTDAWYLRGDVQDYLDHRGVRLVTEEQSRQLEEVRGDWMYWVRCYEKYDNA